MSHTEARSRIRAYDMSVRSSTREVTKEYISYLHTGDRRLKKTVTGPSDAAPPQPAFINGVRVSRKGKGLPPQDNREQLWSTHGKKEVPGKSHASDRFLLDSNAPTRQNPLTADETRARFVRKATSRFNESSLTGCGIVRNEVDTQYKPWRASGAANPGWGISLTMSQTLSHPE